jgi:hypothetical protein
MEIEVLMVNATHMWRANGSPENKEPAQYLFRPPPAEVAPL